MEMGEQIGLARFGGSLKVESVQALAAKLSSDVPNRYIRPERAEDIVAGDGEENSGERIPVIDFGKLFDPDSSVEEAAKLHSACEDWGFFQLVNHGIPEDVINKVKQVVEDFFKLPLEEKEKFGQLPGQTEGYGQAFIHSKEQKLDWGDRLAYATFPPNFKQLQLWPTNPPSFREAYDAYAIEIKRLSDELIKMISKNLGSGFNEFYDMFKGGIQIVKCNYYPPCPNPDKVLGFSPHSDATGLSVLLQMNELPGLQIKRKGKWFPVKVLPGAFVINVGDVIEILCNGKYKSIEHRVVVEDKKARLSIGGFHTLNIGDVVGPIPEIVKGDELIYKSVLFEEYFKMVYASKVEGKSLLDRMKLEA